MVFVELSNMVLLFVDIKNKIVVVTGATGGIGRPLSIELSKLGAKLILVSRTEEKLQKLFNELHGEGHHYFVHDARDTEKITKLVDAISKTTERVDILFNVAGVGVYKTIEEVTRAEWEESFAINVTTPFFLTKGLLSLLEKPEKSIVVNIGSGAGKIPMACRSVYCSTKYALRGMTLSLEEEFHGASVDFVHIALGSTLTEFGPLSLQEKEEKSLEGKSYFTPDWVVKKFVEIIQSDQIEPEITLYPSKYS